MPVYQPTAYQQFTLFYRFRLFVFEHHLFTYEICCLLTIIALNCIVLLLRTNPYNFPILRIIFDPILYSPPYNEKLKRPHPGTGCINSSNIPIITLSQ